MIDDRGSTPGLALAIPALLGAGVLVALIAGVLIGGAYDNLAPFLAVGMLAVICMVRPKFGIYLVLVALVLEGFFRNLANSPNVLLVKDAMLIGIYLRVLGDSLARRGLRVRSPITVPLVVFSGIVLLESFNPAVGSLPQALVGIHTWLFYVPLYFVARQLFNTDRDRRHVVNFILLSAVPVCIVAIVQFLLGPTFYANLGQGFAQGLFVIGSSTGGIYRPASLFAYSSHFALFLAGVTLLTTGVLFGSTGRRRLLLLLLLGLLVGVNLVEGQRTVFILLPPLMIFILILRRSGGAFATILSAAAVGLLLVLGVLFLQTTNQFTVFDRVAQTFTNQGGVVGAHGSYYLQLLTSAIGNSPIGRGTGATSIAARFTGSNVLFLEFSLARVVGDLGLLGLGAYLWLLVSVTLATTRVHRDAARAGQGELAGFAAAIVAYQLLILYYGYDLAVAAIPFWLLSGMLSPLREVTIEPAPARPDLLVARRAVSQ